MKIKKLLTTTAAACLACGLATAADYSVQPKVTHMQKTPSTLLLVGNSFMYYNCVVMAWLSGINKSKNDKMTLTMATISGAGLDWHLVDTYLRPNGLRSYSVANDGSNKLTFNKYPDGKVFDAVVLLGNSQEPIHPAMADRYKEKAAKHIADIRAKGLS